MKPKTAVQAEARSQLQLPFSESADTQDERVDEESVACELSAEEFQFLLREGDLAHRLGELGATVAFLKQFENWILSNRSSGTAGNYLSDIRFFFSGLPAWAEVMAFFTLEAPVLRRRVEEYRSLLIRFHLKPTTVKRRLTALRVLLRFAEEMGLAAPDRSEQVPIEQVPKERIVRHLSPAELKRLLEAPGLNTLGGLRDTGILHLLSRAALQREEVCALDQEDFDAQGHILSVPYRDRSDQRVQVSLREGEVEVISKYLQQGQSEGVLRVGAGQPLFQNVDARLRPLGERLTGNSIYYIVSRYRGHIGQAALTPRDLRNIAIVRALQDAGGKVQVAAEQLPHIRLSILSTYKHQLSPARTEA